MTINRRYLPYVYGLMFLLALVLAVLGYQASRRSSVIVEWSTATELETAGFNLYRGESVDGPFAPVNSELIPASFDPLTGGSYEFEDKNVRPGRLYYYQLEEVEFSGQTSMLGQIDVRAQGGGLVEFALAGALALAAALGLAGPIRKRAPASIP